MPRTCTVCRSTERESVDLALVRGEPLRDVAAQHGLSTSAVHRHEVSHLPAALTSAEDAHRAARADTVLGDLLAVERKAADLLARSEAEGDIRGAIVALREVRGCVELRARIASELRREQSIHPDDAKELLRRAFERILAFVPAERQLEAVAEAERVIRAEGDSWSS